jgi:hypothetical protein
MPPPEGLRQKVMSKLSFGSNQAESGSASSLRVAVQVALIGLLVVVIAAIVFPIFSRARESASRSAQLAAYKRMSRSTPMEEARRQDTAAGTEFTDGHVTALRPRPMSKSKAAADSWASLVRQQPAAPAANLMIIKTADLRIKVTRFQEAYDSAVSIARSLGGYVTDSSTETTGSTPTYGTMTLRVPAPFFEQALERIGRLGKVLSKSITGQDVTGEAVDLESRIRNKRAEERQYLDIMNRAKRVMDIVTVSNELYRVRGEIEEAQGRLKYLRSAAAMSTINLTLDEKAKPKPNRSHSALYNSWSGAVASLAGTLNALARMLIWLAVYSPFWALPLAIWLYLRRKRAGVGC